MEVLSRTNTLASSSQIRQTSLYRAVSKFLGNAHVETLIQVSKTGTKRNKSFLAVLLVIKNKDIINCALYQIKQPESGKTPFQIKSKFDLTKLRLVNGVSEDEEEPEFELVFEKGSNVMAPLYVKWTADSGRAKKNFVVGLWKLVNEHMITTPQFLNINYAMLQSHLIKVSDHASEDSLSLSKTLKQVSLMGSPTPETKEYKYLTGEEERDLGLVTDGIDWAVENAEDFMEKLMDELSGLTKANIHSIMAVETDVMRLFNIMDHALHELCRLEDIMVDYEDKLNEDKLRVEDSLSSYKQQQIRNENTRQLHDIVSDLLSTITCSEEVKDILLSLPLKTNSQITRASQAVHLVQEKMGQCGATPLADMTCVVEQRANIADLLDKFSYRVADSVSEITTPNWNAAQSIRHSKLNPLLPIVNWLHSYNQPKFDRLAELYEQTAQTTYQKLLREYFDEKRSTVSRKSSEKMLSKLGGGGTKKSELALSGKIKPSSSKSKTSLASTTSLESINSAKSESEFPLAPGNHFEVSVREALDFIEITMSKEENFIGTFFKETRNERERGEMAEVVLSTFDAELDSFINVSCKYDVYYALPIYLSLLDRIDDALEGSFLSKVLQKCLDTAAGYFEKMLKFQKGKILDSNKKSARSTAPSVMQFTQFTLYAESLQKHARRPALDDCYLQLSEAVCVSTDFFASTHSKLPGDVVTITNYHFIYQFLFKNKVECLVDFRSRCHKKYNDSLELYVKSYLGNPLDKLNLFFEGVKVKLNTGVPNEEIGFYPEFSKQKLKALVSEYTVKEVKKGLESVIKKIEKHFTKEQNLFTVGCLTMQAEFIRQVEGYEKLMRLCYPDAGLKLSFTVAQIHTIFDERNPKSHK